MFIFRARSELEAHTAPSWQQFFGTPTVKRVFDLAMLTPYLIVKHPAWLFGIYGALLPFDYVLGIGASTATHYLGIGVLAALWGNRMLVPHARVVRTSPLLWGWIALLNLALLSTLWTVDIGSTLPGLYTLIGLMLITMTAGLFPFSWRDLAIVYKLAAVGGVLAAGWTIAAYASGQTIGLARANLFVAGGRQGDPNYLATSLLLPVALLLHDLLVHKSVVALCGVSVLVTALLLTGSGGGFLGLLAVLLILLWRLRSRFRKLGSYITLALFTLLIVLGVGQLATDQDSLLERYMYRERLETGGAGRLDIWHIGVLAAEERPVTGYGLASFRQAWAQQLRGQVRAPSPHSIWVETLVELGLVGLGILAFALFAHWRRIAEWVRVDPAAVPLEAALVGTLMSFSFLTGLRHKLFWFVFALLLMYLGIKRRQVSESANTDTSAAGRGWLPGTENGRQR